MNILFLTQNNTLNVFSHLERTLDGRGKVGRAGFVVADSWNYLNWTAKNPEFEARGHVLLKEWELTNARGRKADPAKIAEYERKLGTTHLFRAILSDRRLVMGPNCTFSQDYRSRFTDEELLTILQSGLEATERLFDELRPEVVVGFVVVTFLDYLAFLFARARGVRFLNLRPTRIRDNMFFGSTITDPDPWQAELFQKFYEQGGSRVGEAREFLEATRRTGGKYEGVVKASDKPARSLRLFKNPVTSAARHLSSHFRYRASIAAKDNHVPGILTPLFYAGAVTPFRARFQARALGPSYTDPKSLGGTPYAFFPMHAEPEVSLLVYGRPYLNQIEVIRAVADSLPAGTLLLVKEHPWMVGKRRTSYYRKLLEIPRVRLVNPRTDARALVERSKLVVVIAGSVALDAAILKIPAITLGEVPFNLLPSGMIRRNRDFSRLHEDIAELLTSPSHDERALEAYVAAVLESSAGIHWYSVLLGRSDGHKVRETGFDQELEKLADYTLSRISGMRLERVAERAIHV
jgi:hypothetical protein